ncbi:MAG: hypothetical protein ABSD40_14645 [Streptosporangiaceae bacterium]|jgi:hypothetical protein
MNRCTSLAARRPGIPVYTAAMLAAAGLMLAGCGSGSSSGSSSSSSSGSGSSAATGSAAAATSSPASAAGSGGSVSVAYYPLALGNTWAYENVTLAGTGSSTDKVTAVTPAAGGSDVTMSSTIRLPGSSAPQPATSSTILVHPDGSISIPLTQIAGGSIQLKSGSVVWPSASQLASGVPHDSTIVVTDTQDGKTITLTTHVVVKGEGSATVTVPAGTYQTSVISQTMTSSYDGIAVVLDLRSFVANGIGPVETVLTTTTEGHSLLENTEKLTSFTKG